MGVIKQIEKSFPANYGAPGEKREKKQKRTKEDVRRQNDRNRWKRVQRIILANFKEARKHLKKFLDKMRDAYKKAGLLFKWIAVTERGKKGKILHHHLIIEDINNGIRTVDMVKRLWTHGGQFFSSLYEDGEYEQLAEYIVKSETKEECEWCTYSRSRNLVVPQAKVELIRRRKWKKQPTAPKGWYVVKESVWNGINPVTGYPVQHYTLKKLINTKYDKKGAATEHACEHIHRDVFYGACSKAGSRRMDRGIY